jgi:hypothetical protein
VRRSILENDRFYQTPLTPALSPLVPRGEREKSTSPNFCRKCATLRHCITDFGRRFSFTLRVSRWFAVTAW